MVALSRVARSFTSVLALLPGKRHEHVWELDRCYPGNCTICGIGQPRDDSGPRRTLRERFNEWADNLHDVFDTGD